MEFTQAQADARNALTAAGAAIVKAHALIGGLGEQGPPGFFARRQLKEGIRLYTEALKIDPEGWSSMWALGKLHQRSGELRVTKPRVAILTAFLNNDAPVTLEHVHRQINQVCDVVTVSAV